MGRFRKVCIISFDFMRTVRWPLSYNIGYVWIFMQLRLPSLKGYLRPQSTCKVNDVFFKENYANFLFHVEELNSNELQTSPQHLSGGNRSNQ